MEIQNLKMPPFNTSLIGILKGVLDYYGIKASDAMAFGGSGHAFLINISEKAICPSGPYCWKYDGFFRLIRNMGIEIQDLGFFDRTTGTDKRKELEQKVKRSMDNGLPCSVLNMDNQLIRGYNASEFMLIQPWCADCEATPPTLTFNTWAEFGEEVHVNFFLFKKIPEKDFATIVKDSIEYAVDLFKNPDEYRFNKYAMGLDAYDNWIKGVEQGHGGSHGNWWNGVVWSECRHFAAEYLTEIVQNIGGGISGPAKDLSLIYQDISDQLKTVSNKELDDQEKIRVLSGLKIMEKNALDKLVECADALNQ
jgi:hypothetical protein